MAEIDIVIMIKEKTYTGNLNIAKKIVSVDTDIDYRCIIIHYIGQMNIKEINADLIINDGRNKILIMNLKNKKISELFGYRGMALFSRCILTDRNRMEHNLYINKSNLELWNTLHKNKEVNATDSVVQVWESLTRFWEDMDFDGNNAKKPYIHRTTSYDKETKTYTTIKEIRKK